MRNYLKLLALLFISTLAFQGFQCSSREMTTAKVAITNGDTPKAIENLQAEISKNPKNAEAYILLAELKQKQGDLTGAIALMNQAEPLVANDPKLRDRPSQFKFTIFKTSVDNGQEAFNKYVSNNKNTKALETAIKNYTTAITLRPMFFEGYRRIGLSNEFLNKPDEATEAYLKYVEVLQPTIDVAVRHNFGVGTETKQLQSKIGKAIFIRGAKFNNGDSTILEKYTVDNAELYVLSLQKSNTTTSIVESWSFDPPMNILQGERELVPDNISQPINSLAAIYYQKKDNANSLKYFQISSSIDPSNVNANSAIVALYQEMGKGDAAVDAIKANIQKNPSSPIFVAQLGDVYMNNKDFDRAIEQYEKALQINDEFDAALRNVAACYGNKAAKIQQEQNELVSSGKAKAIDINTYSPLLLKAAENFTKCLQTTTYKNNPDVMGDLVGIYLALLPKEQAKFDAALAQFEGLENTMPKEDLESYYYRLLKIYGQIKSPKLSDIETKINKLN